MRNAKSKLLGARVSCPGLEKEVYILTDYMALISTDFLSPKGLFHYYQVACFEICNAYSKTNPGRYKELLKKLNKKSKAIMSKQDDVLKIVEIIADKEFSEEFKTLYNSYRPIN
ncbi:MAG: hypothetical protein PHP54_01105 [Clostridia bacterium]|nr:hypothetical protein [Clostridia bacterium]